MAEEGEMEYKLIDAMWQILDDMGKTGTSVCLATKAQARIAFEPFYQQLDEIHTDLYDDWMSLEEAQAIISQLD
jgi:hypothetical protein